MHPLYGEAVCGEPEFRHPASADVPTCVMCAAWQPAPLRPQGEPEKRWTVEPMFIKANDSFEVKGSNARMVAVEDITIRFIERYDDVLYAVDELARRWPMDLPIWRAS